MMCEDVPIVPEDRTEIDLSDETNIRYWAMKLGVSQYELERTVARVGSSAEAVAEEISKG